MRDNAHWFGGKPVDMSPTMYAVKFPSKKLMRSWLSAMRAIYLTLDEFCPYVNECTYTVLYHKKVADEC